MHEIPDLVRELSPLRDWKALRQLRALIREIGPDVVHTHSSKAGVLGRMAAWKEGGRRGRPLVVHTIHGPPFHRYERAWRNGLYAWSERFAAKRCHRIVSVADAMTEQYLARGIGRAEQYITVHSGMETEAFLRAKESRDSVRTELGIGAQEFVIGTVARLADLKGHDDLIDALAPLLEREARVRLLWIGDGWKREDLERRLDDAGLRDRVTMTGLVPPARVPAMIGAMDLLVHPSYREGLPRAVPQALLAGVPVVASDVDGTREACIDKETGRLYPAGDVGALRDRVEWILADPERAQSLAHAGRESCRERFDWRVMVERLEEVYGEGAKGQRGRGAEGVG